MMRLWIVIGLVWVWLMGCADLPVGEQNAAAESVATVPVAEESTAADGSDAPIAVQVSEWAADTLLNAVAQLKSEMGPPVEHSYVEFGTDKAGFWQGEALFYEGTVVMLVQQKQTGNSSILRIDVPQLPDDMDPIEEALTPQTTTTEPPDVEVTFVRARLNGDTWNFDVSVDHPDTGWEDYTDGWHVETPNGQILATRILLHPHVGERPFTRSQGGVVVPDGVTEVYIRSHDLISGYGPRSMPVPLTEAANTETYQIER